MTSYRKTMREAREEMLQSLNENNLEKMRKAAGGAKQTLKMKDGSIGMDSFTASAIMQIYDKVNDKNKKTMENLLKDGKKADIVKLMKFAMSKVNAEYVPEEFEEEFGLDEGTKQVLAHGGKGKYKVVSDGGAIDVMFRGKSVGKGDFDRGADSFFISIKGEKGQKSFDDAQAIADYFAKNKITEEVELDEAKYDLYHKDFSSAMQHSYKMAKKLYGITVDPKEIDDKVASGPKKPSEGKTNSYRLKGDKGAIQVQVYNKGGSKPFELNMYKEEVELDEEKGPRQLVNPNKEVMIVKKNKVIVVDKKDQDKYMKKGWALAETLDKEDEPTIKKVVKMLKKASGAHAGQAKDLEKAMTEEDEIDEGKMSQLHQLMKDGKSAKEIAKIMKLDVKTIQALMDEKSELEENLDGRTREYRQHRERLELMRSKRQEARHVDPADIDTSATDDDIKAADKNIMMQLRKSVSLRGQFPVEFLDKKKVKIPQKIAQAAIAKYNSLRKPMDKEMFQSKIAKSHRDLLMALKEGFASDAQRRAAFASGYKEKDKKKKESTLERMNKKLQEKKDG